MLTLAFLSCLAAESTLQQPAKEGTVVFARSDAGKLPAAFKEGITGKAKGSVWRVVADGTAPSGKGFVLAQTSQNPGSVFNLCILSGVSAQDVEVQADFKAHKGVDDQGGGLVWHYKDDNNYYVARMNPLESNFRVYKVEGGKRLQLDSAKDIKIETNTWHTIKVRQQGSHITCFVDGKKYLDVKDDTFPAAGKIGLWTKADAETYFDRLHWNALERK